MTAQRLQTAAPYFSLARASWIPYAITWNPETGAFRGVEGPRGFATYREAVAASRFLVRSGHQDNSCTNIRGGI